MTDWGVDLDTLTDKDIVGIKKVPGRVAQIDADFIAYQAGYAKDAETYPEQQRACEQIIQSIVRKSGATAYHLHLTPTGSNKGGRKDAALFQAYQEVRADKDKPEFLHELRAWMGQRTNATEYTNAEADDGMCMAQTAAIERDETDLSVICSQDKDLRMVSGHHLNWDKGGTTLVHGYGSIRLDESGSSKKVVGYGTSFFWCQMLMGDPTDAIKGLPHITGDVLNGIKPTAAVRKAIETIRGNGTARQVEKAQAVLNGRKDGTCGAVTAFEIINRCKDDRQAYRTVRSLYQKYHAKYKPVNYRTGEPITWQQHLASEMKMLWMQRYPNKHNDVLDFLRERVL